MMPQILVGDCRKTLQSLPDESVQMCCTSPPYWGLRSYLPKGHPSKALEIGQEKTPEEYVANLVTVFNEVRRVLKKDGTLWLNLGDSYASNGGHSDKHCNERRGNYRIATRPEHECRDFRAGSGLKPKDLVGTPWMTAFALRASGWWLRSDIIWNKLCPMPESVRDRPTRSHEYIFLLSKSERYYYDADAIKEPCSESFLNDPRHKTGSTEANVKHGYEDHKAKNPKGPHRLFDKQRGHSRRHAGFNDRWDAMERSQQVSGVRNKRDVWTVAHANFKESHFACVDEETECLTSNGWKRHSDICPGDMAAQFDITKQKLSWGPIEDVARYSVVDQEMVLASRVALDMMLTPNHRCVIQRRHPKNRKLLPSVVVRADELKPSHAVPTAAEWDFHGDDSLPLDWAELVGWYIAEGHESKDSSAIEIYQSQSANPGKVNRIEDLLRKVGAEWTSARYEREWRGRPSVNVAFRVTGYAAIRLRELSPGKAIPEDALMWSDDRIRALLTGLIQGDGHTRLDDSREMFVQKKYQTAGMVQALAIRIGLSAVHSKRGDGISVVYLTKKRTRSFRGTAGYGSPIGRTRYSGIVWCPKTQHGTWMARRNGRTFITGNTFPPDLIKPCILAGSRPGDTVLDCFAGSGTSGEVAIELGRKAILCELQEEYIPMIEKRTFITPGLALA